MKNTSFTVNSISAAWAKINEIFPSDYNKDEASSERAGYNIFRSSVEHYNYICDLGNRLEVNLASGETVNIWIREKDEAAEIADIMNNNSGKGKRIEMELTARESKETKHFYSYSEMINLWRFWFASGRENTSDEETFEKMIETLIKNDIPGAEMGIVRNGLYVKFMFECW